ncbi:MAG: PQQ-dependent dehydrogenase, methanol/ethanol family [Acidobacteriota bacterium]
MRSTLNTILFIAGLTLGWLPAQHRPNPTNPFTSTDSEAIGQGKEIYENRCQSCHGGDGRGSRGPALDSGRFEHGGEDAAIYRSIRHGIRNTQMPAFNFSDEETWHVITYLRSLKPRGIDEQIAGDPAEGKRVYEEKAVCSACHQISGSGGRIGPDLSTIGHWTVAEIRRAVLEPGKPDNVVRVTTRDGKVIRGLRKNEDTFSLQLLAEDDEVYLLDKKNLAEIHYEKDSLMPADYGRLLSETDLQNLLAYLKTLRTRDMDRVAEAPLSGGLAYDRIVGSRREPANWLTYWGDYQGHHYSPLRQITTANVNTLQARWAWQFSGEGILEATPLVVDGILYTTGPSGYVMALDARTGRQIWRTQRRLRNPEIPTTGGNVNRGVAMLGQRLFFTTVDAFLVALDAKTGRLLWETEMANVAAGYSGTMSPLALKDKIIAGISGAEFGIRGFVDAYDPATGRRLWRFYTVPGPGQLGNNTWEGDSWKRGGGSTWMTGTYDPELDLLYWGIGNPSPDMDGEARRGDNLFTCSVVALDAKTGERRWHFQFTPHDTHDWDSNETPVLVDRVFGGRQRKLLLHADRNAFFYVLDRTTGEFLLGTPFSRQTWAKGLDARGRPIPVADWEATEKGVLHYPSLVGATNWQAPSYDPDTGWFYLTFRDAADRYFRTPEEYKEGKAYWGGKTVAHDERERGGVKALDPETGKTVWESEFFLGSWSAGVLATGGGVLFAATRDGYLLAYDSRTGKSLWRFQTGATIDSSPMSYAVDGRQFIALSAGGVLYTFTLPETP